MYVEGAVLDKRAHARFSVRFLITKITETVFGVRTLDTNHSVLKCVKKKKQKDSYG